jgi:hypothetical protein
MYVVLGSSFLADIYAVLPNSYGVYFDLLWILMLYKSIAIPR